MFYLITVQNGNTPSMLGYESHDAALAAFHTEMAYRAEGRTSTKCLILDSDLNTHMKESYTAPVSDNTEEPVEG